jgi:hypothetical protein
LVNRQRTPAPEHQKQRLRGVLTLRSLNIFSNLMDFTEHKAPRNKQLIREFLYHPLRRITNDF